MTFAAPDAVAAEAHLLVLFVAVGQCISDSSSPPSFRRSLSALMPCVQRLRSSQLHVDCGTSFELNRRTDCRDSFRQVAPLMIDGLYKMLLRRDAFSLTVEIYSQ